MRLTDFLSIILLTPSTLSSPSPPLPPSLSLTSPHNLTLPPPLNNYDPQCHRITDPPQPGLRPSNCDIASEILCLQFSYHLPENEDRWLWVEQPGCAVAVWDRNPHPARADLVPCPRVFEGIIAECVLDSRFNAGSVNVEVLPDFSQGGGGRGRKGGRGIWLRRRG